MGHHKIRRTVGKRPKGVWYPLRPRLGFEHATEHCQCLDIPEPAIVSQPEEKVRGKKTSQEEGLTRSQSWRVTVTGWDGRILDLASKTVRNGGFLQIQWFDLL